MFYESYHGGMVLIWWIVWVVLLFWTFKIPYRILGEPKRRDSPLNILQSRFFSGQFPALSTRKTGEEKTVENRLNYSRSRYNQAVNKKIYKNEKSINRSGL